VRGGEGLGPRTSLGELPEKRGLEEEDQDVRAEVTKKKLGSVNPAGSMSSYRFNKRVMKKNKEAETNGRRGQKEESNIVILKFA